MNKQPEIPNGTAWQPCQTCPDVDALYEEAHGLLTRDPHAAICISDRMWEESERLGYHRGLSLSRYVSGFCHFNLGEYTRAMEIFEEGDAIASKAGIAEAGVKFRNAFGTLYFQLGRIEDSIREYSRGLETARELELPRDVGNFLINIGLNYMKLGNPAQALEFLTDAEKLVDLVGSEQFTINVSFNKAEALNLLGRVAEAEEAYLASLELAIKAGKHINQVESRVRLGTILASRGNAEAGLDMIQKALAAALDLGFPSESVEALLAASSIELGLGKIAEAAVSSGRAVELARAHSIQCLIPAALEYLARAENAAGNHEKAYRAMVESTEAVRSWSLSETSRLLAELETGYRMQSAQNEALRERERRQELEASNERLRIINRVGKILAASLKPVEILSRLWDELSVSIDISDLGLGLCDQESAKIDFVSWIERGIFKTPGSIPISEVASLSARCVRERRQQYFSSRDEWIAALGGAEPISLGKGDLTQTILYLPLMKENVITGVLSLQSELRDAYSPPVIEMIQAIVSFVSIAVENSLVMSKLDNANHIIRGEKEAIEKIAEHDTLTGLANRVLLDKILENIGTSVTEGTGVGILYVDLDGFKDINDRYGHSAGDRALVLIAERMKSTLRSGDHVARVGGDEFVIVLPGIQGRQSVSGVLEKIARAFRAPIDSEEGPLDVRLSIGVSLYPGDGTDFQNLVRYADEAMYKVKRSGKSNWCFWSEL